MPQPYFGATGFMASKQVSEVGREIGPLLPTSRRLMAAILVSGKTLRGQRPSEEWAGKYPVVSEANDIWAAVGDGSRMVWRAVHLNTAASDLACDMGSIMRAIPLTEAIQLNMYRPDTEQLRVFRTVYPEVEVVLQVGSRVLADMEVAADLATYLAPYRGFADYVLLDPSGGRGSRFDAVALRAYLEAVPWDRYEMLPGVAGGLSAATVGRLEQFLRDWPRLCWDAEGQLMTGPGGGLDTQLTLDYLRASCELANAH